MPETLRIEVAYADPQHQVVRSIELPAGSTVEDALRVSAILDVAPADFTPARVGIFGQIVKLDAPLRNGDRVELYRPLKIDPKEARHQRVTRQKSR
jgi:putative ubiquitin-RnfH superfamily antitoxin RatB of RatAB toxin-antitoxin module